MFRYTCIWFISVIFVIQYLQQTKLFMLEVWHTNCFDFPIFVLLSFLLQQGKYATYQLDTLVINLILELIVCAFLQCIFFWVFKICITLVCLMALHQHFLWLIYFFMFRKVKLVDTWKVAVLTFLLLGWLYVPLLSLWGIWRKL